MEEKITACAQDEAAEKEPIEAEHVETEGAKDTQMPLAWHRFQKNFLLWLLALGYGARAFLLLSGHIYYNDAVRTAIYRGMPLLRALDYAFAAHCIAAVVLMILSALRLNRGHARPLLRLNIALAAGEALYLLLRWAITGLPPVNAQGLALLAAHALLLWVNRVYYRRRSAFLKRREKA